MLTSPRPIRVVVLCSRRAPGLRYLLDDAAGQGTTYEIVGVMSSDESSEAQSAVYRSGVSLQIHSIRRFVDARGASLYRDFEARAAYDLDTVARVDPHAPDLVLLDGYRYLVTWPLLTKYAGRLLNLHFSDLTLRLPNGRPRFPGLRAVRDAIATGHGWTRATVHLITAEADAGPPLIQSWPFPVSPLAADAKAWGATDILKAYAYAHQEWMMRAVAGPLWAAALRLVKNGVVDLTELQAREAARTTPWTLQPDGGVLSPWSGAERLPVAFMHREAS